MFFKPLGKKIIGLFLVLIVGGGVSAFFVPEGRSLAGASVRAVQENWRELSNWLDHTTFFLRQPRYPAFYTGAKFEPPQGIYLGAYILQDETIKEKNKIQKFNALTGKKHASFFRYVGYGEPFPKAWVTELKREGAVPQIAWEPNQGLDVVQDNAYLRSFAREAKEAGIPIFLRFASEMNGDWAAYSGNPQKYIEKWCLVHRVMAEEAPNVALVWTVFAFPQKTIPLYYPGDAYVDWVGVNIYNVVYHNNDPAKKAAYEDPLKLLDYVYRTYGDRKPIVVCEYGATHYTITDNRAYPEFACKKITRMYNGILKAYPRVKAIYYFNVNNIANAPSGRRINDYSLTTHQDVLVTYQKVIQDPVFLTEVTP